MKKLHTFGKKIGLLVLAVIAGAALAQEERLSIDEAVIKTGLQGDAYEILSSELALERSGSDQIQQFAQMMIDDHTATSNRLHELAESMNVDAEFTASPSHGLKLARLEQLEGDQFDVEYLSQQRMAHTTALMHYSIAAELAEDEELARFAADTAAAITEHLRLLQDLMANLGIHDAYGGFFDAPMGAPLPETQPAEQPQEEQPEQQPEEQQPEDEQPVDEEPVDQDTQDDLTGEEDDEAN